MRTHATRLRIRELEKRIEQRFTLAQRAVEVALASQEKRLDGMNEFRDTLKDQAGTFVTRQEAYAAIVAVASLTVSAIMVVQGFWPTKE